MAIRIISLIISTIAIIGGLTLLAYAVLIALEAVP